ncbi:Metal-dependent hydrolase, endonuclease/exonuclease/phosphatase family [Cohaesibacter sp. ES.047]|uniref:endonuclease n=1 Tax=Cohaesibacter sp. ES.047 TaxID=1798205 RepID=UPI000BB8BD17|nr:endonuclease [Cohaesibacter sp. ES.047]SNY90028.1 Metal-dependent hydrolase, endonuclease/exonuclease/phosphatase family [Cohaesibacter sp. ES.047]
MTTLVSRLPDITKEERARIQSAERVPEVHRALLADIPAMTSLEVGGDGSLAKLPRNFKVAAWNMERCYFPGRSAAHIAPYGPSIILLSEMDNGMARTGQRNTAADMARALGMHYAYGVEFFELELGSEIELPYCKDDFNASGWHGNAILSTVPFTKLALFRLDEKGRWFCADHEDASGEPRMGGRMAIAAIIDSEAGPVCVVSTHLESAADADYRKAEFTKLLRCVEDFAPDMPVLIGGDLNTGNHVPPDYDWRQETLFDFARDQGYSWDLTPDGMTIRSSLITPNNEPLMKLDWFFSRGLDGTSGPLLEAIDDQGPLSDHECVLCSVTL